MFAGHDHRNPRAHQQSKCGKRDAPVEKAAAAAGEIKHGIHAVGGAVGFPRRGQKESAPVKAQGFIKIGHAQFRPLVVEQGAFQALAPHARHKTYDPVLHFLPQRGGFGGPGHAPGRVVRQPVEDTGLDRMPAHAFFLEKCQHGKRHRGGFNLDRAYRGAAAAAGAVLHHMPQFLKEGRSRLAAGGLGIVDGFGNCAEHHVLVARMVLVGAFRVDHGTDLLALAAAGAGLHGCQQLDEAFLVLQAALPDILNQPVE